MNTVQNINRIWIEKDSGVVVRNWTDEEYKTLDPRNHIFEKYWCYYCPICGFLPTLCGSKAEAKHAYHVHKSYTGHRCEIKYRDFELVCLEEKDEFLEDLGVWVHKQELY